MRSIFNFCLGMTCIALAGCADNAPRTDEPVIGPRVQVFAEEFDTVWKAAQIVLSPYPVKINDLDSGILETDFIKGDDLWSTPGSLKRSTGGTKYKITINILKGKTREVKKATRVTISKHIENQKDFFSPVESVPSDGLEENALIYRIEREIQIDRGLQKARVKQ